MRLTYYECENCHTALNEAELEDPIMINAHIYCDKCASEVIAFRYKMRQVAEMTKELPTVNYDMEPIAGLFHDAINDLNNLKL